MRLGSWIVGALTGAVLAAPVLAAVPAAVHLPKVDTGNVVVVDGRSGSLQEQFLRQLRNSRTPVTVFLVNGVKLQGVITAYDGDTILLINGGNTQLVYKHAVSTIIPAVLDPT